MPHISVTLTKNLHPITDWTTLLRDLNLHLSIQDPNIKAKDCKARLIVTDAHHLGTDDTTIDYIHVELHLLSGRSIELKTQLANAVSQLLFEKIQANFNQKFELTCNIIEMQRETYIKLK